MVERLFSVQTIHLLTTGLITGIPYIFGIMWIFIPACLIKQPNRALSRMCKRT